MQVTFLLAKSLWARNCVKELRTEGTSYYGGTHQPVVSSSLISAFLYSLCEADSSPAEKAAPLSCSSAEESAIGHAFIPDCGSRRGGQPYFSLSTASAGSAVFVSVFWCNLRGAVVLSSAGKAVPPSCSLAEESVMGYKLILDSKESRQPSAFFSQSTAPATGSVFVAAFWYNRWGAVLSPAEKAAPLSCSSAEESVMGYTLIPDCGVLWWR
mmetsp:Transcript_45125/g.78094  ORF Transcript_45125/g.78094 Transcript_45125/m.78094 type:complete len:212 (-) Transcript_45125:255-890(-)